MFTPSRFALSTVVQLSRHRLCTSSHLRNLVPLNQRAQRVLTRYENFIGLTTVKQAQSRVIEAEESFIQSQFARREQQEHVNRAEARLRELHSQLEQSHRGEDRYLALLTEEHAELKREKALREDCKRLEAIERDQFSLLSAALRFSHEKEREQSERTKYWSVIASVVGALMGIIGSAINNRLRLRELRDLVVESSDPAKVKVLLQDLSKTVEVQQQQVRGFLSDVRSLVLATHRIEGESLDALNSSQITANESLFEANFDQSDFLAELNSSLESQDRRFKAEMEELKSVIAAQHGIKTVDGQIIYVGPQMESLLGQTEQNLEYKMKVNTLTQIVAIYGAMALLVPVLYSLLGGGGA